MKIKVLIINSIVYCCSLHLAGQSRQTSTSWFAVKEISPKIWLIDDHKAANIYLVEGLDSALLIDTGIGAADLFSQVKKLTSLPLIVVNTHGHSDHTGANYQFNKIFINAGDSAEARSNSYPAARANAATNMLRGAIPSADDRFKGKEIYFKMVTVTDGQVFNLGGRHIQIIATPGHTPGSICLLDVEDKLLFTGDNDNTAVWLFLPNSLPLSEYLETLKKLINRISEFDSLLPGHGIPKKNDFILDQVECVKSILNQTCTPEPYNTFAGKAMLCKYGRASVGYNPDNLYKH
jgi:hydroxyacylglutathione hydrolase